MLLDSRVAYKLLFDAETDSQSSSHCAFMLMGANLTKRDVKMQVTVVGCLVDAVASFEDS